MKTYFYFIFMLVSASLCNGQLSTPSNQVFGNDLIAGSSPGSKLPLPIKSLSFERSGDGQLTTDNDTVFYTYNEAGNVIFQHNKFLRYTFQYNKAGQKIFFAGDSLQDKTWNRLEVDSFQYNDEGKEIYSAYYG